MVPLTPILCVVFLLALLVCCARPSKNPSKRGSGWSRCLPDTPDTDRRRVLERPLVSSRYGLTGKPDYLVQAADGLIPLELKSRECPLSGPHVSEAAQLTAYYVLVEDSFAETPSHGIVQYADRCWPARYSLEGRKRILQILDEMRAARDSRTVHRNHEHTGRCHACGYRTVFDEALN